MNPNRFDSLTRSISTRANRRSIFKLGGAGLAATMLGSLGLAPATARQAGGTPYTVIRSYKLEGTYDQVTQAINSGYLPSLQQEPGFLTYSLVSTSETEITTIATFASQADYDNASGDEAQWVSENLASILPAPAVETHGNAVIWAVNTDEVCGDGPAPTEAPTEVPPTEAPATEAPCTGIGCTCNGGVEGACDDGLVCCQSQMGGGPIPGGEGMCAAADACGDNDATPVT
jgi:hypothetical protein